MISTGYITTRYIQIAIVWRSVWVKIWFRDTNNIKFGNYVDAVKSLTFKKSWGVILFKFWWHIEKHLKELGLGPGFSSMSQLSLINLMRYNRYLYLYIYEKQCLIMKDISLKKNTCFKKRIKWNTKLYYCVIEAKW